MKTISTAIAVMLLLCTSTLVFSQEKVKIKDGKMKTKGKQSLEMNVEPYTAHYSSNFSIGNSKYSSIILNLWKDYDNNDFGAHDYLADSVVALLPDGTMLRGKQQVGEAISKYRSTFSSVSSTVDAWIPLHSVDRNADWVGIWGTETDHFADGKTMVTNLQETWGFNKDGKIITLYQYAAKAPQN